MPGCGKKTQVFHERHGHRLDDEAEPFSGGPEKHLSDTEPPKKDDDPAEGSTTTS